MRVLVANSQDRGGNIWHEFDALGCGGGWRMTAKNSGTQSRFFDLVLVHAGEEEFYTASELADAVVLTYRGYFDGSEDRDLCFNRAIENGISRYEAKEIVDWITRRLEPPLPSLISDKLGDDDFLVGCLLWLELLDGERSRGKVGSPPPSELLERMKFLSADIGRDLVPAESARAMIGEVLKNLLPDVKSCRAAKTELSEILEKRVGDK